MTENEAVSETPPAGAPGLIRGLNAKMVQRHLWVLLVPAFLFTTYFLFLGVFGPNNQWRLFDWLINYEAGFVRRGLFGQIMIMGSDLTGLPPHRLVFIVELIAYLLFFLFVYKLLAAARDIRPVLLMVLSPFLLYFQIHEVFGGFRKEILFLMLLSAMLWHILHARDDNRSFAIYLASVAVMPLLILSNEMLAFYSAYLLFPLFLIGVTRRRLALTAIVFAPSVVAGLLAATFIGTPEQVAGICASLIERMPPSDTLDACTIDGAIAFLAEDMDDGLALVQKTSVKMLPTLPWAILLSALSLVPVIPLLRRLAKDQPLVLGMFLLTIAVSILGTVVLFVVAMDWGRFIYIHIASISVLSIALIVWAQRHDRLKVAPETLPNPMGIPEPALVMLGVVYFLGWGLQYFPELVGPGLPVKLGRAFLDFIGSAG